MRIVEFFIKSFSLSPCPHIGTQILLKYITWLYEIYQHPVHTGAVKYSMVESKHPIAVFITKITWGGVSSVFVLVGKELHSTGGTLWYLTQFQGCV